MKLIAFINFSNIHFINSYKKLLKFFIKILVKRSLNIETRNQFRPVWPSENNVLRAQVAELTDRLKSLNSVLQIASEVSGLTFDIPVIPDSLLEPWQLPCPIQPIPASTDVFRLINDWRSLLIVTTLVGVSCFLLIFTLSLKGYAIFLLISKSIVEDFELNKFA